MSFESKYQENLKIKSRIHNYLSRDNIITCWVYAKRQITSHRVEYSEFMAHSLVQLYNLQLKRGNAYTTAHNEDEHWLNIKHGGSAYTTARP
jgi:hypothetical protein